MSDDNTSKGETGSTKRVKLLYTGGTIGMQEDEHGSLVPSPGYLTNELATMPEMSEMPSVDVQEFDPLIDSSDMDKKVWVKIAELIEANYFDFDGFVVLMGTDTMAYTASMLSFMLENIGKPVIFTGSQIPLVRGYTDARRNLLISIYIAGTSDMPETAIFFHDRLIRGTRSKKMSSNQLEAFDSPNFPELAHVGVSIEYNETVHLPPPKKPFKVHKGINDGIACVRLIPGFIDDIFPALNGIQSLKAIILELYGTGNAPSRKETFLAAIRSIIASGKLVVVTTQCPLRARVDLSAYAVGRLIKEAGCISAHDMTVEAASTKLAYLFGLGLDTKEVAFWLTQSIRGEMTVSTRPRGF